jgi:hypothetical protein
MSNPWFMYEIVVFFGNPNYDSGYGGAHDLDIGAPANYEVTALLPGTILSITEGRDPSGNAVWGRQMGIRLDQPYKGIPNMAYLHLSAVNLALREGHHVSKGDIIGWVGGGNSDADYGTTSNPTGQNFSNTAGRSSRIQVGVALMRGPEYGNTAFNTWQPIGPTPVEWELDPTQLILDARRGYQGEDDMLQITDPFAKQYFTETATTLVQRWHCTEPHHNHDVIGAILAFYRKIGGAPRLPTSGEMRPDPHVNVVYQEFEAGVIVYDPNNTLPHPAGFNEAFLLMLNSDEVQRIACG